jgi:anti-anti-sigma factor
MSENFTREFAGEILIEKVNLDKATLTEAVMFKERLLNDSISGYRKIIVDFSNCSYVDSSIVGALVVLLKRLKTNDGKLIVVIPKSDSFQFLTGLDKMFNFSNTLNEAIFSLGQKPDENF